jgi:virginiamycin B lyase
MPLRVNWVGETSMRLAVALRVAFLFLLISPLVIDTAAAQSAVALTGQVTSADEGAMEGVLVSAKKGTVTITVVSDAQGRYSFPSSKLTPGQYTLSIRAIGYDLDNSKTVDVGPRTTTHNLTLRKTEDLAAQMSNGEWLHSIPGSDQQKGLLLSCVGCHTLERFMRSSHDANALMNVTLPRMQGYVNQSIPQNPQLRRGARLMEERGDQRVEVYRKVAEYLGTINLNGKSQWAFDLKMLPRPTGRATRVIYTEYDLPRETISPHDVVLDKEGIAWYSSFGEQFVGRLDPKTGESKEYAMPVHKPDFPKGSLGLRIDNDGNLWLGNMYQAAIVRFDPKTEQFKAWPMPPEYNIDASQVNMVRPESSHVDGKVWSQNNGFAAVHRLDLASGQIQTWEPFKTSKIPHNIYDVVPDSKNNVYFTDFRNFHIGRIDAKTGEIKVFAAPTPRSAPRRGYMDSQDRLWFGMYRADRIGMFDTRSESFKEWVMPTKWASPYDVVLDRNEEAWTGSMLTDQVTRLNVKSGEAVDYLLPRTTNIRRVYVDNTTNPVTFWVGSNHGASIIKLEPLD